MVIFVEDITLSKAFYEIMLDQKIKNDFGENIEFESGLSLWYTPHAHEIIFDKSLPINKGPNFELYFESDNIEKIFDKIKNEGVKVIQKLHEEPWGHQTFRFYDPDNYIVEIGETVPTWIERMSISGMTADQIHNKTTLPLPLIEEIIKDKKNE